MLLEKFSKIINVETENLGISLLQSFAEFLIQRTSGSHYEPEINRTFIK